MGNCNKSVLVNFAGCYVELSQYLELAAPLLKRLLHWRMRDAVSRYSLSSQLYLADVSLQEFFDMIATHIHEILLVISFEENIHIGEPQTVETTTSTFILTIDVITV